MQWLHDAEESLLQPGGRSSADRVAALLAEDFIEFGSSGKIHTKQQAIETLRHIEPVPMEIRHFQMTEIAPDVILITYHAIRTDGDGLTSLRSSLWKRIRGSWQIIFHQGTSVVIP